MEYIAESDVFVRDWWDGVTQDGISYEDTLNQAIIELAGQASPTAEPLLQICRALRVPIHAETRRDVDRLVERDRVLEGAQWISPVRD